MPEGLLLLKRPRWPALSPKQRCVSSRLAQTLGHITDYCLIDSLAPMRVTPPGQALFSLSFVSPGPGIMPSSWQAFSECLLN